VCERCAAGKGCGAGLLGAGRGPKRVNAILSPNLEIHNGDRVSIVLEPRNLLRASVIVYGYPLLGAVLAAIMAMKLEIGDAAGAVAALVGLIAGMLIAKMRLRKSRCLRDFTPVIVERLTPGSAN
jgi:sigma-E factor negative regulatory protein RseC